MASPEVWPRRALHGAVGGACHGGLQVLRVLSCSIERTSFPGNKNYEIKIVSKRQTSSSNQGKEKDLRIITNSNLWRCVPQLRDQLQLAETVCATAVAAGRSAEDLQCLAGQVEGTRALLERAIVEAAARKARRGNDV
jgi:hypothetical protein